MLNLKISLSKAVYIFIGLVFPFIVSPVEEMVLHYDTINFKHYSVFLVWAICIMIGAYMGFGAYLFFNLKRRNEKPKINKAMFIPALFLLILSLIISEPYVAFLIGFHDSLYIWSTISGFLLVLSFFSST